MADAHVGDKGTILEKTIMDGGSPFNLAPASEIKLIIVDAKNVRSTVSGVLKTDGTDGVVRFTTAAQTWRNKGPSFEQVQIVAPSGCWSTDIMTRNIQDKL